MKTIAVFGSAMPMPNEPDYQQAYAVGQALSKAGFVVMTGGYSGVMEAASKGAHDANGHVVGVTCGQIETFRPMRPNAWVKEEIKYPTLDERLRHLVLHADGYVVMPGGLGTLNELIIVWEYMRVGEIPVKPLVCFGKFWQDSLSSFIASPYVPEKHRGLAAFVDTPDAVVKILQNGNAT